MIGQLQNNNYCYVHQHKKDLRQKLLKYRTQQFDKSIVREKSKAVCSRAAGLEEYSAASMAACYMACQGEVDLTEIMNNCKRTGKEVLLPRFNATTKNYEMAAVTDPEQDTEKGYYGILEPQQSFPAVEKDILRSESVAWLVPGVAFDCNGHRLGRGGGWYDSLLKDADGIKIGVCWDWQVQPQVPVDGEDVSVDIVVTDKRDFRCPHENSKLKNGDYS